MIKFDKVVKNYGTFEALKKISLDLEKGKVTCIVGPNGAGKSTLLKIILGLVKSTAGDTFIEGLKLNGDWQYRNKIGYMPQAASFPENLTVAEIISMIKDLRYNSNSYDEELVNYFNLKKDFSKRIKNLSGGTRQKVSAAIAFLFKPEIIILDEPTAGLDPVSSRILKNKIIKENEAGMTIILTSHILSELEELAQNVVFILDGSIFFNGTFNTLLQSTEQNSMEKAIARLMERHAA